MASATMPATSGIRDEPPTSSTVCRSAGATRATCMVRRSTVIAAATGAAATASTSARVMATSRGPLGR
jgi:hypothetical protein